MFACLWFPIPPLPYRDTHPRLLAIGTGTSTKVWLSDYPCPHPVPLLQKQKLQITTKKGIFGIVWYQYYHSHTLIDLVCPICWIFWTLTKYIEWITFWPIAIIKSLSPSHQVIRFHFTWFLDQNWQTDRKINKRGTILCILEGNRTGQQI